MPTSKLFWNKDKNCLEVEIEKKGVTKRWPCSPNTLASGVPREISDDQEVIVEFDRDTQGNVVRVWLQGEKWTGEKKIEMVDYSRGRQNPERLGADRTVRRGNNLGSPITSDYPKDFYNPYNFVPAKRRDKVKGELGDRVPTGHARFVEGFFTGKLSVRLTVETPVVAIDTARVVKENDHKYFPVRVGDDGLPVIETTAVKGMLRVAYEAVTNSRMAVFSGHDERLAFRPEVGKGAAVVPVRIENRAGDRRVVFYTGSNKIGDLDQNGAPNIGNPVCAAWLPRYAARAVSPTAIRFDDGSLPWHGDRVSAYIEKFEHYRWDRYRSEHIHDFNFWKVRTIVREGSTLGSKPDPTRNAGLTHGRNSHVPIAGIIAIDGIVLASNHNMQNKHDEKVFFQNSYSPLPERLSDDKWRDLSRAWKELVKNYRSQHERIKGQLDSVPSNLNIGEWSRHIQEADTEMILGDGTLCFAEVEKRGTGLVVKRLLPVMVSRQLFEKSPSQILDPSLHSASRLDRLSPADRVFGCVLNSDDATPKESAYRGQIRIGSVSLAPEFEKKQPGELVQCFEGNNANNRWLPLNVLGQPKPQQGRFYVAEDDKGSAQKIRRDNQDAGYNKPRALRGRKVYPHHGGLSADYWFQQGNIDFSNRTNLDTTNCYREYLRPPGQKQRNNQNRSIEGWIKPKTEFVFDIHFTNLSVVELGALVWLLDLPHDHFHRLGGGKPLGFGSVALRLDSHEIKDVEGLRHYYGSLNNNLVVNEANDLRERYLKLFEEEAEKAGYGDILAAFLKACRGFGDKPTRYPRVDDAPNAEGQSFKWFVANSDSKNGLKLALPDLLSGNGLPKNPKG